MRQNRGSAGSIADGIACALRCLTDHLRSKVLFRIFELDFFCNGNPIIADKRPSPLFLDQHAFGFWTERDADSIGKRGSAGQNLLSRCGSEK